MTEEKESLEKTEIKIGEKVTQVLNCSQCQKEVTAGQCYTYKDKKGKEVFLCDGCKEIAEQAFKEETKDPNITGALLLGTLAAVVAGIVWFAISVLTGYQVGYVAIGVGFLIGYAVIFGSGKKRGAVLQMISALITAVTLFSSQYAISIYYLRQYLLANKEKILGYNGQWVFLSPFSREILSSMVSPMGLLICAIGIYFAYSLPKSRSI